MHAVVWTSEGTLFSWGDGESGELGHGSNECSDLPRQVQALEAVPIASAAAGQYATIAHDRNGNLWSWGKGSALGHGGDFGSQQLLPKVIEGLPQGATIRRIATYDKVVCEYDDSGIWNWGANLGSMFQGSSTPSETWAAPQA